MEKEETLNKEDQNLKDENSDLSKDKQASDETGEREDVEQLSPEEAAKHVEGVAIPTPEVDLNQVPGLSEAPVEGEAEAPLEGEAPAETEETG